MTDTNTARGAADLRDTLISIAREIEALKRECGMDPKSPIAIQNGRYMALSYKVRALAAGQATTAQQGVAYAELPDDRESFKTYLKECDECAIVPDVAGAFNAAWQIASHGQAPAPINLNCKSEQKRLATLWGFVPAQAAPAYKDSTPELHIGDSAFESWYSSYNPTHKGDKQRARDAYAAGMGDPLVMAAPAAVAGPSAITASIMRDDGGEQPAFCLMVAYRSEKDARAALAMIAAAQPISASEAKDTPKGCVVEPLYLHPSPPEGMVAGGSLDHLKLMMEHSAFAGALQLDDALANIDEFACASLSANAVAQTPAHIKAMERAWLWMENQADSQSKGGHATFDLMMLREERDALRAALDAAPIIQPAPKQEAQEHVEIPAKCPYFGPSPHRDVWLEGWYAACATQPAAPQAAGKAVHQFRKQYCADWYDGRADHGDSGGPYEERTLYTVPQPAAQGDALDAMRYRWLRHGDNDEKVLKAYTSRPSEPGEPTMFLPRTEELDRLIDAARAAQEGK